jgi:pimeloyl-ACP methyl ester carboxylesterase
MRLSHERRRDEQAWVFDWVVKQSGRVQNFEYDTSDMPSEVKSYVMVPKHAGRQGSHREAIALAADEAGHTTTARELYWQAILSYTIAQHAIYEDDNHEKIKWYGRLAGCFDRIMALSPYPMERVEVPWEGNELQVVVHSLPDRRKAPCVIFIPGMDSLKERQVNPLRNVAIERGMHCISMDGPGQGISNLRKIRITADNYERAVAAVVDYARTRPEIDPDNIMVLGTSMGSFWAIRAAAHDPRIRAVAAGPSACFGGKTAIFDQSSPRFKRVFMYMTGVHDEDVFDRDVAAHMSTVGYGQRITGPALLMSGEFDPLSPLEDMRQLFDELAGPKEMWVMEDDFHGGYASHRGLGDVQGYPYMVDWLKDVATNGLAADYVREVWIPPKSGRGPYG